MFIIISNIHITTITNSCTIEDDADDDDDDGYGEPRRRIHKLQIRGESVAQRESYKSGHDAHCRISLAMITVMLKVLCTTTVTTDILKALTSLSSV